MVPGFAERERRVADAQRRDWLAKALMGPARTSSSLARGPGPSRGRVISAVRRSATLIPERAPAG